LSATADANILINTCRLTAQRYYFAYQEPMPVEQLVRALCDTKQVRQGGCQGNDWLDAAFCILLCRTADAGAGMLILHSHSRLRSSNSADFLVCIHCKDVLHAEPHSLLLLLLLPLLPAAGLHAVWWSAAIWSVAAVCGLVSDTAAAGPATTTSLGQPMQG
jgi:hypothetical protein